MVEIYCINIDQIDPYEYQDMYLSLSAQRKASVCRCIREKDAQRAIVSETLIKFLIKEKLNLCNSEIEFQYNDNGKPFLKGFRDLHYNISHSDKWVVCALSEKPVGVDIEKIKLINFEIAKRFFSFEEYNKMLKLDLEERVCYFFDLWTLKESYLKLKGLGLSQSTLLKDFTFSIENFVISFKGIKEEVYFKQYDLDPKYKLSVCSYDDHFENIKIINTLGKS